jgi:hypothetical protein
MNYQWPYIPSNEMYNEKMDTRNEILRAWAEKGAGKIVPTSWNHVQELVRAGLHNKVFHIKDKLTCQRNGSNLDWVIIGKDHDAPSDNQYSHSMTLRLLNQFPTAMQFDAPEAFYYAENGLAVGDYYFTIDSTYDTTYNDLSAYGFTLAEAVPAGGVLTFPWTSNTNASAIKVSSYASRESTTPIETVSVSESTSGTNLGELKVAVQLGLNLNGVDRVRYGSNNYKESAIRQWLNSDKAAGQVWTPQTLWDRPPAWTATADGFMRGMDADFLATIGKTHIVTARAQTIEGGAAYDEMDDYFFLLSRSQVYGGVEVAGVNEGAPYPYYSDYSELSAPGTGNDANRITTRNGVAAYYWLRTPYSTVCHTPLHIYTSGNVFNSRNANGSHGILPACNII